MTQAASPTTDLLAGVDVEPLYTPFDVGSLRLKNRFVMAPMTRSRSPGGVPTDEVAAYYAKRAPHLGLIVTEGTYVGHPSAGTSDKVPRFYGDDALQGWKRVADAVHGVGGLIVPQLWHVGLARQEGAPPHPDAPILTPSGIGLDGQPRGVAAEQADLDAVVAAFTEAAVAAQRLGFDGVELHGAHSYLLDSFLWKGTNRRNDGYGGSAAARARLPREIVASIRSAVGPRFLIAFRFSQWKGGLWDARIADTPAELEALLGPLAEAGVGLWHVSTRRFWEPGFPEEDGERTLSGWVKRLTGRPTIALGSVGVNTVFRDPEAREVDLNLRPLLEAFEREEFDLVGLGRAVLSDAAWTTKVREGRPDQIKWYEKAHEGMALD